MGTKSGFSKAFAVRSKVASSNAHFGEASCQIRRLKSLLYFAYQDPAGGAPIEVLKVSPSANWIRPDEYHKTLDQSFGDDPQKWPSQLRAPIGDEDISIVSQRCGLHGENGVIVAASRRADF